MKNDILVGYFFITHDHDGEREYQGRILASLENGFYLVQLYSWLTGCDTIMRVFSMNKLGSAYLFQNMDDLVGYMEANEK